MSIDPTQPNGSSESSDRSAAWQALAEHREQIADRLSSFDRRGGAGTTRQMRRMARWLRHHSPADWEAVDDEVATLCLSLMADFFSPRIKPSHDVQNEDQTLPSEPTLAPESIDDAIRWYRDRTATHSIRSDRRISRLAYPFILILVALAIFVLFSFTIARVFEEFFIDFEINLPSLTRSMLGMSRWVRDDGLWIVTLLLIAASMYWIVTFLRDRRGLPSLFSILWRRSFNTASEINRTAEKFASLSRHPSWLSNQEQSALILPTVSSLRLRRSLQTVQNASSTDASTEIAAADDLRRRGGGLLPRAFAETDAERRVLWFEAVRDIAADRCRRADGWKFVLLSESLTVVIGCFVVLMFLSVMLPLLSLISWLS